VQGKSTNGEDRGNRGEEGYEGMNGTRRDAKGRGKGRDTRGVDRKGERSKDDGTRVGGEKEEGE